MKINQLVSFLEKTKAEYGNIEVRLPTELNSDGDDDTTTLVGTSTFVDDKDKAKYVLLCDDPTYDALN